MPERVWKTLHFHNKSSRKAQGKGAMVGQSPPLNDPHMNTNVTQPLQLTGSLNMVYFNAAPHPDQQAIYYSPTETQMQPHIHHVSPPHSRFSETFYFGILALRLCWCSANVWNVSDDDSLHQVSCHLLALAVVGADVGELPADVEQHVILSRRPLLHKVRGKHPGPENDAVIFKTACRDKKHKVKTTSQHENSV